MNGGEIFVWIITAVTGLILVIMGIFLLLGHGSLLIAGYNTLPKDEKEKYDTKALCKFIGKIVLPMGLITPLVAIGGIYNISWLITVYVATMIGLAIFTVIYVNTGNRFKK